jgi:glycosyltransferase involved in cell wall biosynthesis
LDKEYAGELHETAKQNGLEKRVHFLGGVPLEQLVSLYRRADLTIFTSHQETFGIGVVESLGCGTPVVGPEWIIPSREILEGLPGGWTAEKDPESFAHQVIKALDDRLLAAEISEAAKKVYGSSVVGGRFSELVLKLFDHKQRLWQDSKNIDWKGLYRDAGNLL